jgi:hypothetical protein
LDPHDFNCCKYEWNGLYTAAVGVIFQSRSLFNTCLGTGAVGAIAESRYFLGAGSTKINAAVLLTPENLTLLPLELLFKNLMLCADLERIVL